MPLPDADTAAKISSETAQVFVSNYYQAVSRLQSLDSFYVNSSPKYSAQADISINGAVLPSPAEYHTLLEQQGQNVSYEVESFDAHVMNPSYKLQAPPAVLNDDRTEKRGDRMSVVLTTMGRVKFGRDREAEQKMFNETFVLVPNWDALGRNPPRGVKKWLIMSQNFRAL